VPGQAEYILYHTLACHLCELAEVLVQESAISYVKKDIADDDALIESYGTLIPVLLHVASNVFVQWPFDAELLLAFTANNKS
jgi:hypothetical protein